MNMLRWITVFSLLAGMVGFMVAAPDKSVENTSAETTVLTWKDGKQAVFLLTFDDACPTHRTKVIPELVKRKIPGTFYVIAGNDGLFGKQNWAELAKDPNVVLGNHTLTHGDCPTVEHFEKEIAAANDVICKATPQLSEKRLISFGKPGGVKWGITDEQINAALPKHNLVRRPDFHGYPYHVKSFEAMRDYIEKTIRSGKMGHLDFHGVDGDWLSTPWDIFSDMLDTLEANRDKLWLTDAVAYHKYLTERTTATVTQRTSEDGKTITVELTCKADPKLYDMPLTLSTPVPDGWKRCRITQGVQKERSVTVEVKDGRVIYDALPGDEVIEITELSPAGS